MRLAEIGRLRKNLEERHKNAAPCIAEFGFRNLPGFADATVTPGTGFLAICGGTGLGKTALLELFQRALGSETAGQDRPKLDRLGAANVSISVTRGEDDYRIDRPATGVSAVDAAGYPAGVHLVGLSDRTFDAPAYFRSMDISTLKDGVDGVEFDVKERDALSAICRKEYSKIVFFEVEGPNGEIVPLFELEESGSAYNSVGMATGELSAIHLAWALRRAEAFSVVIIEEPEAYLPSLSHSWMFGLICSYALEKRLAIILSTHSPIIASDIPAKNLLSLRRQGGTTVLPSGSESKVRVLAKLGMRPIRHAVLFVEDDVANYVTKELAEMFEFSAVCNIEVVTVAGGAGAIRVAIRGLPQEVNSVTLLGVLDGDMTEEAGGWDELDRMVFLPFKNAMEVEFLEALEAAPTAAARELGRTAIVLSQALDVTRGTDHHDRYIEVAATLGIELESFSRVAMARWLRKSGSKSATGKFVRELAAKLDVELP